MGEPNYHQHQDVVVGPRWFEMADLSPGGWSSHPQTPLDLGVADPPASKHLFEVAKVAKPP